MADNRNRELDTVDLLKILNEGRGLDPEGFAETYLNGKVPSFPAYMDALIGERGLLKKDVIRKADLPEKYGYKLLSGENHTTERDYILRFCLALGLDLTHTNRALELYGMRALYPKDRRDMVLIIAINRGVSGVDEANELLTGHGEAPLARSRE